MRLAPVLKSRTFLAALALITGISIAAATTPEPLKGADIQALVSGNSMAGNGKNAAPHEPYDWQAFYGADGTMIMRLKPEWGGIEDSGKWWVSDKGELCRQFKQMAFGKTGCWHLFKEDKFIRLTPSSGVAVDGLAIVLPGNILEIKK